MKRNGEGFWARRRQLAALLVLLTGVVVGDAPATAGAHPSANAQMALSKMGVASASYLNTHPVRLSTTGASWVYDWYPEAPPDDAGMQWVPMVPDASAVDPHVLKYLAEAAHTGAAKYLLGFNEPDIKDEADMTPEQAANLWPKLESTGLQLGSPAPARPYDGWLAQFMQLARERHLRVNFLTLHYYQDFTNPGAVGSLRSQLIKIHNTYRKPIWITEIGAENIRAAGRTMKSTPTTVAAADYLRKLFKMLNALPFVERYAWFTDYSSQNPAWKVGELFSPAGRLSQTGKAFQQMAYGLGFPRPKSKS